MSAERLLCFDKRTSTRHRAMSPTLPFSWLYSRGMNEAFFAELSAWLTQAGLAGTSETDIVSGFCDRCGAAGLPLARTTVLIDTLHPVHEGRLFRWGFGSTESPLLEYGRTSPDGLAATGFDPKDVEAAERWRHSPFYRMLQTGESLLRRGGILAKNDRIDAQLIAEYVSIMPTRVVQRNTATERLTEVVTMRRQLCDDHVAAENQAAQFTLIALLPELGHMSRRGRWRESTPVKSSHYDAADRFHNRRRSGRGRARREPQSAGRQYHGHQPAWLGIGGQTSRVGERNCFRHSADWRAAGLALSGCQSSTARTARHRRCDQATDHCRVGD